MSLHNEHSHDAAFGVLGMIMGILGNILMNEYIQTAIHGVISGAAGAGAALFVRWLYKKYTKK
jgi:hypothetical protein